MKKTRIMPPAVRSNASVNGNNHASHATDEAATHLTLAAAERVLGLTLDNALARYERLTSREREVATLMALGERNLDIAERLGISPKTLDIHRANVMDKLAARTTAFVANLINLLRLAEAAEMDGMTDS